MNRREFMKLHGHCFWRPNWRLYWVAIGRKDSLIACGKKLRDELDEQLLSYFMG
jgi:hypothetical protein